MKNILLVLLLLSINIKINGQAALKDSLQLHQNSNLKLKGLIIPSALLGCGLIGLESHTLKNFNASTSNEITEHIDKKLTIDDFSQYSPLLAVYGLNVAGIKGKNNFRDRTIILATSYLIMGGTVGILKNAANEVRPDLSSNNSFPSGHTATAFMGAEFLYQEYKNVSVWYGISGYLVAAGTGAFRMYNNRHWFTDVAAGAGIGILSTKIAYWVHPLIKRTFFKNKKNTNGLVMPFYDGNDYGLAMAITF